MVIGKTPPPTGSTDDFYINSERSSPPPSPSQTGRLRAKSVTTNLSNDLAKLNISNTIASNSQGVKSKESAPAKQIVAKPLSDDDDETDRLIAEARRLRGGEPAPKATDKEVGNLVNELVKKHKATLAEQQKNNAHNLQQIRQLKQNFGKDNPKS